MVGFLLSVPCRIIVVLQGHIAKRSRHDMKKAITECTCFHDIAITGPELDIT